MSIASEINRIKTNIANAYDKAEEKGATMPAVMNSSNLASTIESISGGSDEWKPQPDWWDIDSILENDTENYSAKMILLMDDASDTLTLPTSYSTIIGAKKIKMSDGTEYYNNGNDFNYTITHTWDKTKDKPCNLGYKTRYVIFYFNTNMNLGVWSFEKISDTLYMIIDGATITTSNASYNFPYIKKIQAIKMYNCIYNAQTILFSLPLLKKIYLQNCDFSKITNLFNSFNNAIDLQENSILDFLEKLNLSSQTSYDNTFTKCINIKELNLGNTSNIRSFRNTFNGCYNLKKIILGDTSQVTNFSNCFSGCYNLENTINLDLTSCTSIDTAFSNCTKLKEINLINKNSNLSNYANLFSGCYNLTTINTNNVLDTTNCTNIQGLINSCYLIEKMEFTDTSQVTNFFSCFSGCYSLRKINSIDFNSANNVTSMFTNCFSLSEITNISNIKISGLNFSQCPLSHDTLIRIRDACYDYSSGSTHTIIIGPTNIAKLNEDELAVWQDKNWTIS